MPVARHVSGLAQKLGRKLEEAVLLHRKDETVYDTGGGLPAGIEGGIAQLVDCKFSQIAPGKQNAGQYVFYAAGVVLEPKEFQGQMIEGLRTQITEPLFETPGRSRVTIEDHVRWILNEMRKLGVDTSGATADDLEALATALKEQKPYFRFRTWKGAKATDGPYKDREPRVQHVWNGVCNYVKEGPLEAGAVQDNTEEVGNDDEPSLDSLVASAEDGDEFAQDQLRQMAMEAGITEDEVDAATDWETVRDMIVSAQRSGAGDEGPGDEEEEEDEEEDEESIPVKGDIVYYKPPKSKKVLECEITAVFEGKRVVNLKSSEDGRIYKGVSWDAFKTE